MKYLGIEFKNYEELNEWNRQGHIAEYKKLAKMFNQHSTMELNNLMCERASVLHDHFHVSWDEIEQLELETIA